MGRLQSQGHKSLSQHKINLEHNKISTLSRLSVSKFNPFHRWKSSTSSPRKIWSHSLELKKFRAFIWGLLSSRLCSSERPTLFVREVISGSYGSEAAWSQYCFIFISSGRLEKINQIRQILSNRDILWNILQIKFLRQLLSVALLRRTTELFVSRFKDSVQNFSSNKVLRKGKKLSTGRLFLTLCFLSAKSMYLTNKGFQLCGSLFCLKEN